MPHGVDLSLVEKTCEIISCGLFVSIPVITVLLLFNIDTAVSTLLTYTLVGVFLLLALIITGLALYRVYGRQPFGPYANVPKCEKHAISELVAGNVVATGQLMVPYGITDLDLQLKSLNLVPTLQCRS